MIKVKPFPAVRPPHHLVHLVASRSYISYSKRNLREKLEENPFTFIHIINPEFGKEKRSKPNSTDRFSKVKEKYQSFLKDGYFSKEESPAFYIYEQSSKENTFIGVIGGAWTVDYDEGRIKIHEQTLTKREEIFKKYLEITGFNAEPVLLTHEKVSSIEKLIGRISNETPEYDFSTTDKKRHRLWVVKDEKDIEIIEKGYAGLNELYIADGHHRSASSALMAKENSTNPNRDSAVDYCMAYLIPEDQLNILEFNRLVKDLNGLTVDSFIQALKKNFEVTEMNKYSTPARLHEFSMYVEGKWYRLSLKSVLHLGEKAVDHLDPEIISKFILEPVLNIQDQRTDKRIEFRGGNTPISSIQKEVDKGKFAVAFTLYPVSIEQLKEVADNQEIMPPKSTWIEPKLRSGLTIYEF